MDDALVLRDLHASVAPSPWPPAPGWWLLALALLLVAALAIGWRLRRARRRRHWAAVFDAAVDAAPAPAAQVAAVSALLRRAARRIDPAADRLQGQAWLEFLDAGARPPRFDGARGRLLLDGPFLPGVDAAAAADLRGAARERFLHWMDGRG